MSPSALDPEWSPRKRHGAAAVVSAYAGAVDAGQATLSGRLIHKFDHRPLVCVDEDQCLVDRH
jgi:hypothetical protein